MKFIDNRRCKNLKSPEIYDLMLEFVGVKMSIVYFRAVKVVHDAHLKEKKPKEFPDFA